MQQIDVRPQTQLSLVRTFGLCLKGIKHRLFRSVLTTMVIILAVAFFMNLLADSVIARAVDTGVKAELTVVRSTAVAGDLWFGRPSATLLASRLAAPGAPVEAYAAISGWEPARFAALVASCRRERVLLAWLGRLDAGTRAMLVRRTRDEDLFAWLANETYWTEFAAAAERVRADPVPLPLSEVRQVVAAAPATAADLAQLSADWAARIAAVEAEVRTLTGGADREAWTAWLADAKPEQLDNFAALLAAHDFAGLYPAPAVAALQPLFRLDRLRDAVSAGLVSDEGRKRWLASFRTKPGLDEKLLQLDDRRAVEVLGGRFTAEELAGLAHAVQRDQDLSAREKALIGKVDPDGGLVSTRQALLVAISFLVCMVGIANAMLMAITERFREIATMKCLGATDGFILTQFLMEAGIQGAAGGAMGTVVGLLLSLTKGGWMYGGHLIWYFPALHLLVAVLACIVAGLLLATLASIYPSWVASRMAPMEAMRVE
jgi:hypothetical protein